MRHAISVVLICSMLAMVPAVSMAKETTKSKGSKALITLRLPDKAVAVVLQLAVGFVVFSLLAAMRPKHR